MSIEPHRGGSVSRRLVPSAVTFVVVGAAIYFTVYVALGLLRHVVMPIVAVVIAGYLAQRVYKITGRRK